MTSKKVDSFVNQSAEWLRTSGPESEIVVSSRLRLARNLANFPFVCKLSPDQSHEIITKLEGTVKSVQLLKDSVYLKGKQLNEVDRQFLVERHLISRDFAETKEEHSVAISKNEVVSLMILEEDHLRLQAFQSGFNLIEAWRIINQIDNELEKNLEYSFSSKLGYLTACPTNVGTGLRASCMLHLPSLVITKQVTKVLQALSKLNLAARGLYGEGTQATGNLFQFSNQMTLGQQEEEIIDNLVSVIRQVIEHEKEAREYLRSKKKAKIEDQVWRALGTLKTARIMASAEATQLLSLVHLGSLMGILDVGLTRQDLNALFLLMQPAHLQKISKKELSAGERDIKRAELIRKHLGEVQM